MTRKRTPNVVNSRTLDVRLIFKMNVRFPLLLTLSYLWMNVEEECGIHRLLQMKYVYSLSIWPGYRRP